LAQRQGIVYAEGILGYLYQNGLGTVRDLSQALFHYQDGSSGGDQYSADQIPGVEAEIACQDAAGSPYEPGGVGHGKAFLDIDPDSAIAACENAISVNSTPVGNRVWLARAYARAERYQDAVPLLEEGVAAGNVLAHAVLGDLLMAGAGIEEDPERAISLYRAVADTFGLAQLSLGVAYREGRGVPEDREQALHWLRLARNYGVTEADAEITALLAEGEGEAAQIDLTGFGREGPGY
jgi:TPR repeat protein